MEDDLKLLKVKYFSNHLLDPTQISYLSLDDQTLFGSQTFWGVNEFGRKQFLVVKIFVGKHFWGVTNFFGLKVCGGQNFVFGDQQYLEVKFCFG